MCKRIHVLLIEDDMNTAELTIQLLKAYDENFKVSHVVTLQDGLNILNDNVFDLVLLDLVLPNGEGIAVFEKVHNKNKDIPIIIVSGYEEKAIEAVQKGAQDYIVKPLHSVKTLGRSIKYAIERKKAELKVRKEKNELMTIFNNLDVLVYVSDPNDYRILYTNNTLREHFEYDEWTKCYKLFLDRDKPCNLCENMDIDLNISYEWEFKNPYNNKWYKSIIKFIKWPGDKIVKYGMAVDITKRKKAEEEQTKREDKIVKTVRKEINKWNIEIKEKEQSQSDQLETLDNLLDNLSTN